MWLVLLLLVGGRAQCVLGELLLVCEHAHRLVKRGRVFEFGGECGDRVVIGRIAAALAVANTAAVSVALAAAAALRWLRLRARRLVIVIAAAGR